MVDHSRKTRPDVPAPIQALARALPRPVSPPIQRAVPPPVARTNTVRIPPPPVPPPRVTPTPRVAPPPRMAVQRAPHPAARHPRPPGVVQPHLLSPITNWLWAQGERLLDAAIDRLVPAELFLTHEESYDAEEREDAEMKRDRPEQWADEHFNAAKNDWNPGLPANAYTIVSTKDQQRWQYTFTGQWLVKDALLRPVKLRAHVHYYVDTQESWRRGERYAFRRVRKETGNFWVQGINNRQALTPLAAVNGAPNLPVGWADAYLAYLNRTQSRDAYDNQRTSHGNW